MAIKLYQYSRQQPCYYCGALPPSSREHVPPKMMFTGFACNHITVPSCDEHNTQKHIGDRAVVTAIAMSAYQMYLQQPTNPKFTLNVIKAMNLLRDNFRQVGDKVELRELLDTNLLDMDTKLPYIQPSINIKAWMVHLTAALLWSVIGRWDPGIKWTEASAWSPTFVPGSGPFSGEQLGEKLVSDAYRRKRDFFAQLPWRSGWLPSPRGYPIDIYAFDICPIEGDSRIDAIEVLMRHRFYNDIALWYTWVTISGETKADLLKVANELPG